MKLRMVLGLFLIWQITFLIITTIAQRALPLNTSYLAYDEVTYNQNPWIYSRANYDGDHYLRIATAGYGYTEEAFFPFYPLLIRLITIVVQNPVIAGLVVSNGCLVVALYLFAQLLAHEGWPNTKIKLALILLLIFPTSFFLGALYSESLLLVWVLGAFLAARKGKWWLAGLLGCLAAFSRFVGIMLFPALLWELFVQKKFTVKNILAVCLIPAGLGAYMLFLHFSTGDALAFFHVQSSYGQFRSDHPTLLPQVFWRYLKMIFTVSMHNPIYLNIIVESAMGLLFLVTSVYGFWRQRGSYALYGGLAYLLPTLTGSFVSLPRYVLVCFPAFMLLAEIITHRRRLFRWSFYLVSGLMAIWMTALFVRGYWIA